MKTIRDYEILDHGIDHSSYFPGCGTSFTQFTDVATGIGNDALEAYDDALEQLATNGWDVANLENGADDLVAGDTVPEDSEDVYYYVSIRVK